MVFFLGLTAVLIFFGILIISKSRYPRKFYEYIFYFISFILLFLLSGFRGLSVGTDTTMYVRVYNNIQGIRDILRYSTRFEIGYRIYNSILVELFHNPHFLLMISTFITLSLFYVFFTKKAIYPWYSILLFVTLMLYYNSMCLLRQYIAISIVCLSMTYWSDKKYIKFIIGITIAISFHLSAIIVLMIIPLSKISLTKKNSLFIIFAFITACFGINVLMTILIRIVPKYSSYINSNYYVENKLGSFIKTLIWGAMFAFENYVFFNRERPNDKNNYNWHKIEYFCSLLAFAIAISSLQGAVLERIGLYFSAINCVMIPNSLYCIKPRRTKYAFAGIIFLLCLAYNLIILFLRPYWSGVIPYIFWD